MKFAQDIVLAPVITENSMAGIADKKYTFKVATNATKVEIAQAVEELFGVKVAKVNTEARLPGDRVLQQHGLIGCRPVNAGRMAPPRGHIWGYDPDNKS